MSIERVAQVLNLSMAKGSDKVVLLGIANHDGDGGAWPTIATLMKYTRTSERSVQESIARLVKMGELTVHRNEGGTMNWRSDRRPNRYVIHLRGAVDRTPSPGPDFQAPVTELDTQDNL